MDEESTYQISYNDISNLTSLQTLPSLKGSTVSVQKSWSFLELTNEEDLDESNVTQEETDEFYFPKSIISFQNNYLNREMWPTSDSAKCNKLKRDIIKRKKNYEMANRELNHKLSALELELAQNRENLSEKREENQRLRDNLNESLDLIGILIRKINNLMPFVNETISTPNFQLSPRNLSEDVSFMR